MCNRYAPRLACFFLTAIFALSASSPSASFRILSTGKEIECNGTSCTICVSGKKHQTDVSQQLIRRKRQEDESGNEAGDCEEWKKTGRVTLELAVFADHALYQEFHHRYPSNSTEMKLKMQEFLFSIVQQGRELFASPTLNPKVHLEVVEYKVILHKFRRFSLKKVRQDMPSYMDSFCRYQRQLNVPKRWDHAVLFAGFDLIHSIHQGNFAGYSSAKSVCGQLSCSLVEASSFKSAYTLAHEIGHSLGMNHDNGSEACPSNCCLMSSIIFSGSQNWSRCSVSEFHEFLESIPCRKYCLNEPSGKRRPTKLVTTLPIMPGQAYTAFDQCKHFFGPCSKPYVPDSDNLEGICAELWCTYHDGTMRLAHAAMEGTYCADGKWCRFGKCIRANVPLEQRNGQWSPWIAAPADNSCGFTGCSKREIYDQLSVQRQLRSCSNPSPNNGAPECQGDMYRGVVCNDDHDTENLVEEGTEQENTLLQTVIEFASKICTSHKRRTELENDTFVSLSGDGFQRATDPNEPNACYVWCSTVNSSFTSYTFFDAFPDGTPCGDNRFCVSGKCMARHRCNATLALLTNELPSQCLSNNASKVNKSSKVSVFSAWSPWSECSRTCGIGVKRRVRLCTPPSSTTCSKLSNTQQFQFCRGTANKCATQIPIPTTTPESNELNGVQENDDPEKGQNLEDNDKNELDGDIELEKQKEVTAPETSTLTMAVTRVHSNSGRWSEWSSWNECSSPCNGFQKGTRTCLPAGATCRGPETKKRACNTKHKC